MKMFQKNSIFVTQIYFTNTINGIIGVIAISNERKFYEYLWIRNRTNQTGKSAIRCRINCNKNKKKFSSGPFVNSKYWNSKKQKVVDDTEQSAFFIVLFILKCLSLLNSNLKKF